MEWLTSGVWLTSLSLLVKSAEYRWPSKAAVDMALASEGPRPVHHRTSRNDNMIPEGIGCGCDDVGQS
uniref:Secreted protein n=1 Tax=Romanomermis culicivorax TaxID=13658 RepID=A0A915I8F6_ROMCU